MSTVYRTIGRAKAQQRRVSVTADRGEGHNGRPLYPVTDDPRETKGKRSALPPSPCAPTISSSKVGRGDLLEDPQAVDQRSRSTPTDEKSQCCHRIEPVHPCQPAG